MKKPTSKTIALNLNIDINKYRRAFDIVYRMLESGKDSVSEFEELARLKDFKKEIKNVSKKIKNITKDAEYFLLAETEELKIIENVLIEIASRLEKTEFNTKNALKVLYQHYYKLLKDKNTKNTRNQAFAIDDDIAQKIWMTMLYQINKEAHCFGPEGTLQKLQTESCKTHDQYIEMYENLYKKVKNIGKNHKKSRTYK